ncbi:MAG: 16S rRNA (adenine(1518)-N(6)/adenine(1519)-N(6))-dimethyltransferase RsmA [Myxococcales bacterium]|jgi:16S rRNA (adenine1518-N6/adenine1519-N6)-dimethyltransferase
MPIPPFTDPRTLLKRHGLRPKRAYSQNFLVSRSAVERIAAAAHLREGEPVVELGGGLGTLTAELMRAGGRVLVVEPDPQMRAVLQSELGPHGLEVMDGDATQVDFGELGARLGGTPCVAGNLPYAITGAILRNLVQQRDRISRAVIMIQKEVRDRLLAAAGERDYGALTVFTANAFEVRPVMIVPAGAFHPAPRVRSAVVELVPRTQPLAEETPAFRQVVRAAFQARRKTLRNALAQAGTTGAAQRALAAAGIDAGRRGETLEIAEFDRLGRAWAEIDSPKE